MLRPLLLTVVVALVAACTSSAPSADPVLEDEPTTATSPRAEPSTAPSTEAAPPGPTAPTTPSPTPPSSACEQADRDAMAAAVRGQLDAIVEDDWATALTFTSAAFRATVDEEAFERIIVDGFPVVASAVAADVAACQLGASTVASVLVTVEDADGTQQDLVYLFEREEDGWRIGGAVPAASRSTDEGITA